MSYLLSDLDHCLNLRRRVEEKFLDSIDYLAGLVSIEFDKNIKVNRIKWQFFFKLNRVVELLETNFIDQGKLEIEKICKGIKETSVANTKPKIINFHPSHFDNEEISALKSSVEKSSEKGTGVGFLEHKIFQKEEKKIHEAMELIKKYTPSYFQQANIFVDDIVLTSKGKNRYYLNSGSDFNCFGAIMINGDSDASRLFYAEHIIHELSHLFLFCIGSEDQLVHNDVEERYDAPFRDDKRPMVGNFHAFFVISRIIVFYNSLDLEDFDNNERDEIIKRRETIMELYIKTRDIISRHAKLSEITKDIFFSIKAEIEKN